MLGREQLGRVQRTAHAAHNSSCGMAVASSQLTWSAGASAVHTLASGHRMMFTAEMAAVVPILNPNQLNAYPRRFQTSVVSPVATPSAGQRNVADASSRDSNSVHPVQEVATEAASDLGEFLDAFGGPKLKSRVEARLLIDALAAEAGNPVDKEAHAFAVRMMVEGQPALRFGIFARLHAAYGSNMQLAKYRYGLLSPGYGSPLSWTEAVMAACRLTGLRLADLEAQLLDLRVAHAILHPGDTLPHMRLPVSCDGANLDRVAPETAEEASRAPALLELLATLPPPPTVGGGEGGDGYVPFAADVLARFTVTPATHPALWAGLRVDARATAFVLSLLLNRPTVTAAATRCSEHTGKTGMLPARSGPKRKSRAGENGGESSATGAGGGDELTAIPRPTFSAGTPAMLLYLAEARQAFEAGHLLEDGKTMHMGRVARPKKGPAAGPVPVVTPYAAGVLRARARDMQSPKLGLSAVPGAHGTTLQCLLPPLLASYLGDPGAASVSVARGYRHAAACAIESTRFALRMSGSSAHGEGQGKAAAGADGAGEQENARTVLSCLRSIPPSTSYRHPAGLLSVYARQHDALSAAVIDPVAAPPALLGALGMPAPLLQRLLPCGEHMAAAAQEATVASDAATVRAYRSAVALSLQRVRHAPNSHEKLNRKAARGALDSEPLAYLKRQLAGDAVHLSMAGDESRLPHAPLVQALLREMEHTLPQEAGVGGRPAGGAVAAAAAEARMVGVRALLALAADVEAEGIRQLQCSVANQVFTLKRQVWGEELRCAPFSPLEEKAAASILGEGAGERGELDIHTPTLPLRPGRNAAFLTALTEHSTDVLSARNYHYGVRMTDERARPLVHRFLALLDPARVPLMYRPLALGALGYLRQRHVMAHPGLGGLARLVQAEARAETSAEASSASNTVAGAAPDASPAASSDASSMYNMWARVSREASDMVGHWKGREQGRGGSRGGASTSSPLSYPIPAPKAPIQGPRVVTRETLALDVARVVRTLEKVHKLPNDVVLTCKTLLPAWSEGTALVVTRTDAAETAIDAGRCQDTPSDPRSRVFAFVVRLAYLLPDSAFCELRGHVAHMTASMAASNTGNAKVAVPGTSPYTVTFFASDGGPTPVPVRLAVGLPLMDGGTTSIGAGQAPKQYHERIRLACALFGPLGYLLDDPFLHLLRRGWLSPDLFDLARLAVLKQYRSFQARTFLAYRKEADAWNASAGGSPERSSSATAQGAGGGVPGECHADSGSDLELVELAEKYMRSHADMSAYSDGEGSAPDEPLQSVAAGPMKVLDAALSQRLAKMFGGGGSLQQPPSALHRSVPHPAEQHRPEEIDVRMEADIARLVGEEEADRSAHQLAQLQRDRSARATATAQGVSKDGKPVDGQGSAPPSRSMPAKRVLRMDDILSSTDPSGRSGVHSALQFDPFAPQAEFIKVPKTAFAAPFPAVTLPLRLVGFRKRRHIVAVRPDGSPARWELDTLSDVVSRTVLVQQLPIVGMHEREARARKGKGTEGEADALSLPFERDTDPLPRLYFGQLMQESILRQAMSALGPVERVRLLWGRARGHVSTVQEWLQAEGLNKKGKKAGKGGSPTELEALSSQPPLPGPSREESIVTDASGWSALLQDADDLLLRRLDEEEGLLLPGYGEGGWGEGATMDGGEEEDEEEDEQEDEGRWDYYDEDEDERDGAGPASARTNSSHISVHTPGMPPPRAGLLPAISSSATTSTAHIPVGVGIGGPTVARGMHALTWAAATRAMGERGSLAMAPLLWAAIRAPTALPLHALLARHMASASTASAEGEGVVGEEAVQLVLHTQAKATARRPKSKPATSDVSGTGVAGQGIVHAAPGLSRGQVIQRLRRFNLHSELHAFVTFKTDAPMAAVTGDSMRYFGVAIAGQACAVSPASGATTLHISGLPEGLTHDAATVLLSDFLEGAGLRLMCDAGKFKGVGASAVTASDTELPREDVRTPWRHNVLVNERGEAVLEMGSHAEAVRAAARLSLLSLPPTDMRLKRLRLAALQETDKDAGAFGSLEDGDGEASHSPGTTASMLASTRLAVGWATREEARSRGRTKAERNLPSSR